MVRKLKIESDALLVCMSHAFSTDKEEVMGLLIGVMNEEIGHVHSVIMLQRSDKRKDRVEISPEQLSNASSQAEMIGFKTKANIPMRVIGWYHSHPHITVWPSHVDIRTQSMYQMMDRDFVGLIVSCFSEDSSSSTGDIQVTCFQSINVGTSSFPQLERMEIEVEVLPCTYLSDAVLQALTGLPCILEEEESEAYKTTLMHKMQDLITAIHNGTVYTRAVCQIIDVICAPLIQTLERLLERRTIQLQQLVAEKESLQKELSALG